MFPSTNNTKQAVWVGIGSLCSFGFTIVSSMILSRYFSKENYGTYKQVMYVYNTLLTIFTLGLPKAFSFFLPRVELSQAKSLIRKITNIFFILGGTFSCLLFVFSQQISIILKNPDLKSAIRIFAIVPFLLLPTMGLEGILATYKKTIFLAFYNICTNIFKLLCVSLPVMIWNFDYNKALVGFVIASIITFLLALYLKYYPVQKECNKPCDITYKDIFKFSLPLLTASLWGSIIHSADQFFISRYFGNKVFAEFSNAAIPLPFIGMITGACATVLSPIFSRMHNEQIDCSKEILSLLNTVISKSVMLIYPLLLFCFVFADVLMIILYGNRYESSAIYFRIKTISDFFTIIIFAPLVINIGKVRYYSMVHMLNAILVVIFEFICVKIFENPIAISVVSAGGRFFNVFMLAYCVVEYTNTSIYKLYPFGLVTKIVIPSVLILYLLHWIFVSIIHLNAVLCIVLCFCCYFIIFLGYSFGVKINYIGIIKPLLLKK